MGRLSKAFAVVPSFGICHKTLHHCRPTSLGRFLASSRPSHQISTDGYLHSLPRTRQYWLYAIDGPCQYLYLLHCTGGRYFSFSLSLFLAFFLCASYDPGPSTLETDRACWSHSPDWPQLITTDSSFLARVAPCPGASVLPPQPRLRLNFGH